MNNDDLNRISRVYGDGTSRVDSKIIGGKETTSFTSVCSVEIFYRSPKNLTVMKKKQCTGTLIAPRLVLFANHCVSVPKGHLRGITVTFTSPLGKIYQYKIGPASLFHPKGYDKAEFDSPSTPKSTKDQIAALDYALVVLPKSQDSSDLKPIPMMPLKNLKMLSDLEKRQKGSGISELIAVGYGRFSNIDEVNKRAGVKKRTATFKEWEIDDRLGFVKIASHRDRLESTNERTNIARGDSGGPIFTVYKGVTYLVATVSYYLYGSERSGLDVVTESVNLSVDLPYFGMLVNPKDRGMKFYEIFKNYTQSEGRYGFSYRQGMRTVGADALVKAPKLYTPSIVRTIDRAKKTEIELDRIYKEKLWYQKDAFKLVLACTPLVLYSIVGIRLGLDFGDTNEK